MKIKLSRKVRHESEVADEVKNEQEVGNKCKERRIESSIGAATPKRQSNDWRQ